MNTNDACFVGMRDDVLLLPQLGQLFCLQTRLWIALALRQQLQGIFTSKTMKWMTCWYTTHSWTEAFCSYEKLYAFREDIAASFLNAINTDFEL